MGKIGAGEPLLILGIVLLVFGPAKLPALAKSIGQAFSEFRKGAKGIAKEFEEDIKEETSESKTEETK